MEMAPVPKGPKLSGLCRCREAKKTGETPSISVMIRLEILPRPDGESKVFCSNEGLILPGYRTPPMKPPPMA